jgi:hypothetical protein
MGSATPMQHECQEELQASPVASAAESVEEMDLRVREECAAQALPPRHGVTLGKVVGWNDAGAVLVDYPGKPSEKFLPAVSTVALSVEALGCDVALMFVNGNPLCPMLLGLIEPPSGASAPPLKCSDAIVDGTRVVFTAEEEIVFRCGEASITLTKAGKILLRGNYLLSRSSGVNRIKGGSVQIN